MTIVGKLRLRKDDLPFWILGILLFLSASGFAIYYYYDRYVHPNESLMDRQARQFEQMVAKNPQNADLRVATATYYFESGLLDQAAQQSQEALTINPDHQGALYLIGKIAQKKGEPAKAIANYSRVIELNENNPMAKTDKRLEAIYYQLGAIYYQQGKYGEATESLKRALQIDATDSDAHYALGIAYQKQDDHSNALKAFEKAVRFVPDFAEAYQGMVDSYQALGKTLEMNYARAMVLYTQGRYADASQQLESVVSKAPDFMPAYLGLGLAYEKLGRLDQAGAALTKVLNANPNDVAAKQALGRLSKGN